MTIEYLNGDIRAQKTVTEYLFTARHDIVESQRVTRRKNGITPAPPQLGSSITDPKYYLKSSEPVDVKKLKQFKTGVEEIIANSQKLKGFRNRIYGKRRASMFCPLEEPISSNQAFLLIKVNNHTNGRKTIVSADLDLPNNFDFHTSAGIIHHFR